MSGERSTEGFEIAVEDFGLRVSGIPRPWIVA